VAGNREHDRLLAGGSIVNMRAATCNLATEFVSGHVTQDSAGAFKTLLHESLHRQGFHNERETELFAVTSMEAAGQIVEVSRKLANGWDKNFAWDHSQQAGERATWLSWLQSHRYIARNYLSPSNIVADLLSKESWADRLPYASRA
jgi:hypothetical protein